VLRDRKKIYRVDFFAKASFAGLTNYIIRHNSKNGNMTSCPASQTSEMILCTYRLLISSTESNVFCHSPFTTAHTIILGDFPEISSSNLVCWRLKEANNLAFFQSKKKVDTYSNLNPNWDAPIFQEDQSVEFWWGCFIIYVLN